MLKKLIVGLKSTTTNENQQAEIDIAQLWSRFLEPTNAKNIQEGAVTPFTYVVYTNYQGDFQKGNYDCYLGVEGKAPLPGFEAIEISLDHYEVFDFPYHSPEDTVEARKTIWENKNLKRAYTFDVERYDHNKQQLQLIISTLN